MVNVRYIKDGPWTGVHYAVLRLSILFLTQTHEPVPHKVKKTPKIG